MGFFKQLYLKNFRNYEEAHIEFDPKVNCFEGLNGQGKTNLIEALYLLSTGKSFRTHKLTELILSGKDGFIVKAWFEKNGIDQTLTISFSPHKKLILLNDTPCSSFTALLGILPSVFYSPHDRFLIKGTPNFRRQFLDLQLCQSSPLYLFYFQRFHRALKQRNALLKAKKLRGIELFETEMIRNALPLIRFRDQFISHLNQLAPKLYKKISSIDEELKFNYVSNLPLKSLNSDDLTPYSEHYLKLRSKELIIGYSLAGPHRDDLDIFIGSHLAKLYASDGQTLSTAIALKLAEWNRLKQAHDSPPLFFFDDLSMSLDQKRMNNIMSLISRLGQVFITTASTAESWKNYFPNNFFQISSGNISRLLNRS